MKRIWKKNMHNEIWSDCFNLMKRIWKNGLLQSWSYGARCRTPSHRDAPESRGCQPQAFKLQSQGTWIQCTLHRLVLNTSVLQDSLFQHFRFSFQLPPLLKYQLGSFVERGAGKSSTSVLCPKNGAFPLTIICWPSDFFRLGLQSQDPLFFLESKEFLAPPSSTFHNSPPFFWCQ